MTDDHARHDHVWTTGLPPQPGHGIGIVVVADRERAERGEYLGMGPQHRELTALRAGSTWPAELAPDHTGHSVYSDSTTPWPAGKGGKPRQSRLVPPARAMATFACEAGQGGRPRRRDNNERCDQLARRPQSSTTCDMEWACATRPMPEGSKVSRV